ncbi:TonB-dependent receptor [Flammeovirga aprica JL-4]|uniref:TonB-dependent receptor n=2 Tax=Flammeovirga aprica TaxID=29528 RepID=A0A7X9RSM8_9BACT|nr:TonB-dependent receptor [Flammeovirga aprica JL-4]
MFLISLLCSLQLYAQDRVITGQVLDGGDQSPIPGVNVVVKGTTIGTVTDFDGNYKLSSSVPITELIFTYVGYKDLVKAVGATDVVNVSLEADLEQLEEVVVVGYGVEKKKLNTGATLNVKGEDLQKLNTATAMDALQGITPGVNITKSNGSPGAGTKVVIRGSGTIGNSSPLYIVDGVQVGDIDYLSPSDIETIDVLKDAASSAIYGSRAANGVVLVTTKKGTKGPKPSITFDMFYGVQQIANKPELLNAQQYIEIMNEANSNSGRPPINWTGLVPNFGDYYTGVNAGTNWLDETYNHNAPTQNYSINMSGGNEGSVYSLGVSYYQQDGIIGKQINNSFKRVNARLNTEHVLAKNIDGRAIVKIGQTLNFTNSRKPNLAQGNIYYNDLHAMLVTSPLLPMYATDVNDPAYPYHYAIDLSTGEENPIATMVYNRGNNNNYNNNIVGSAYLNISPIKDLNIQSKFGVNSWNGAGRNWVPAYNLGNQDQRARDAVDQNMYTGLTWTLTNTASYSKQVNKHSFTALLGQEMQKTSQNLSLDGHNENSIFQDAKYAYLDNVPVVDETYTSLGGRDDFGWGMMSYFGRVSYNFNEALLLTGVIRADASSNFLPENRWGVFPSFSAGYILTTHDFMEKIPAISYFKIRGGWGQNGNQDIGAFQYSSTITFDYAEYFFGGPKNVKHLGGYPARLPNPNVRWETSEQANIGFDANFFDDKLQVTADVYHKATKDWLVRADNLKSYGTEPPFINGGEIVNKGYELSIRWNHKVNEFSYGATFSLGYNQNEVVAIDNSEKIIHGQSNVLSHGTGEMYRVQVGMPIGYFWGLETAGVMQTQEEASAWVGPEGKPYFADQQAGDIRFVDQNNDGVIDDEDRKMIGNPTPDYTLGLQLNAEYKGFYTQLIFTSQLGHQNIRSWRSFADQSKQNYTTDVYERWHGPGTSTTKPRLTAIYHQNQWVSDLYVEDADYVRLSNVTVGYDFGRLISNKKILSNLKVYYTGLNLLTFTGYSGMDPEVGYGPDSWTSGIDLGLYPASKTHMLGLSVKF